tara:strand:- start:465 stop:665 length:201 start_codon:yes stop_codon:yes gene_type:complete
MANEKASAQLKVGDLVVYTYPIQFMNLGDVLPYGLVMSTDELFAKVAWSDGEIFLESMVDLKVINN